VRLGTRCKVGNQIRERIDQITGSALASLVSRLRGMREKEVGDAPLARARNRPRRRWRDRRSLRQSSELFSEETNPNKLHDLQADLDAAEVCRDADIDRFVELYLGNAERDQLYRYWMPACRSTKKALLSMVRSNSRAGPRLSCARTAFCHRSLPYSNAS
jgi:hypothetical protein